MIRKLTPKDYKTTEWSGGTTTQIAIFPPEALYAKRDFLWRVSSASVELEESEFTALPDYERLISILEGELVLSHNGGPELGLAPFQVHRFSGADATRSRGRCTDFNLMLRRGRVRGRLDALGLEEDAAALSCGAGERLLLYCAEGACSVEPSGCSLRPGEALLAEGPALLSLRGTVRLMLCRMQTV